MRAWYAALCDAIARIRAWAATHGRAARILSYAGIAVCGLLAGICLIGVLLLVLKDKAGVAEDAIAKADQEGKDAADAERKRLDAMSAHDVVDSLPNAGDVRSEIDAGKHRVGDIFDAARMGQSTGQNQGPNRGNR